MSDDEKRETGAEEPSDNEQPAHSDVDSRPATPVDKASSADEAAKEPPKKKAPGKKKENGAGKKKDKEKNKAPDKSKAPEADEESATAPKKPAPLPPWAVRQDPPLLLMTVRTSKTIDVYKVPSANVVYVGKPVPVTDVDKLHKLVDSGSPKVLFDTEDGSDRKSTPADAVDDELTKKMFGGAENAIGLENNILLQQENASTGTMKYALFYTATPLDAESHTGLMLHYMKPKAIALQRDKLPAIKAWYHKGMVSKGWTAEEATEKVQEHFAKYDDMFSKVDDKNTKLNPVERWPALASETDETTQKKTFFLTPADELPQELVDLSLAPPKDKPAAGSKRKIENPELVSLREDKKRNTTQISELEEAIETLKAQVKDQAVMLNRYARTIDDYQKRM